MTKKKQDKTMQLIMLKLREARDLFYKGDRERAKLKLNEMMTFRLK